MRLPATTGGPVRRPGLRSAAARTATAAGGAGRRVMPVVRALPRPGPRGRRALLIALLATLVLGGAYRFWLRDAPFASVDRVTVTGLSTEDAKRIRTALVSTARTMTTLHVERERLDEIVAGYPVVQALDIRTDFPHGMTIRVIEHEPAAMAVTSGGRVPVAADGTVLEGLPVNGRLPVVRSAGEIKGARLTAGAALGAVRIAGAAPAPLRRRVGEIERDGERGYVARLRNGPEIFFGGATHLRAKWIAAARVLADPETGGATYVDVRLPTRPAVGGLPVTQLTPAPTIAPPAALGDGSAPAGATAAPPATTAPVQPATSDPATEQAPPAEAPATTAPAPPQTPAAPTAEAGGGAAAAPSP